MTKDGGCLPRAGHGLGLQGRIPQDVSSWSDTAGPDISIPRKRAQTQEGTTEVPVAQWSL